MIKWRDCGSIVGWNSELESVNVPIHDVYTCGLLIKTYDDRYIVSSSFDLWGRNYDCAMAIPKFAVYEVRIFEWTDFWGQENYTQADVDKTIANNFTAPSEPFPGDLEKAGEENIETPVLDALRSRGLLVHP